MPADRLLIFGGSGFVGRHLAASAVDAGWEVHATHWTAPAPRAAHTWRGDITDPAWIASTIGQVEPSHIVNAAYIQDGPIVHEVCAAAPATMALHAQRAGSRFIHISTDLVFDGSLGRPYREDDPTSPLTEYGRAKVDAEQRILDIDPGAVVARTSLIYGAPDAPQESLVRRAHDDGDIQFFTDEFRTAVHVVDLAGALLRVATADHAGLLHLAGRERLNRLEFARALAGPLGLDPARLTGRTQDPTLGPRSADVSLDTTRARGLGLELPGPIERSA